MSTLAAPRGVAFHPLHWAPMMVLLPAAVAAGPFVPGWALVWIVIGAAFVSIKLLTWFHFVAAGGSASSGRAVGYFLAWPGMNPREFCDESLHPEPRSHWRWASAGLHMALGIALFWIVPRYLPPGMELVQGLCGWAGTLLLLVFGLFDAIALAWQAAGVQATPIMNFPLASESLADFWSRRWNLAFRDPAHELLFRPMVPALGLSGGMAMVFLLSGLGHELILSYPAGGGYGLPTLYFLLQAAGLMLERSPLGRSLGLARGITGRLYAAIVLLAPVLLLFHPPFLRNVGLPMMQAWGAL